MNSDITTFTIEEMMNDLAASRIDIRICEAAAAAGVTTHLDGTSVADRIRVNQQIVDAIAAELERRKEGKK